MFQVSMGLLFIFFLPYRDPLGSGLILRETIRTVVPFIILVSFYSFIIFGDMVSLFNLS